MADREHGFYWIKRYSRSDWTVAEWNGSWVECMYSLPTPVGDNRVYLIGPQILPPDEGE